MDGSPLLPPVKVLRAPSASLPMTPSSESGAGTEGLNEADLITPAESNGSAIGTVFSFRLQFSVKMESAARADRFAHYPLGFFGVIILSFLVGERIPCCSFREVLLEFGQVFWIGFKIPSKWLHSRVFVEPGPHVPS